MPLPNLTLRGNLTADPELRYTSSGKPVASFTIACNERKRQPDGSWADGDAFFANCTAWDALAEAISQQCRKGSKVIAEGTIRTRKYETRDGEKRTSTDVTVWELATQLERRKQAPTDPVRDTGASWSTGPVESDEPPF